jgi:hypothetical protein
MGSQNQVLLALGNVKAYKGYTVTLGVVQVGDDDFVKYLDETYSEVSICGLNVKPGGALQMLHPSVFSRIKGEYQEELQYGLQGQLASHNDVDIEFH